MAVSQKKRDLKHQAKGQASYFHFGIFDPESRKVRPLKYLIPEQFLLDAKKEELGQAGDNQAFKGMTPMEQKLQMVKDFGTQKAMKKMHSQMTNMVDTGEGGGSVRVNKIRDEKLLNQAKKVQEQQDSLKEERKQRNTKKIEMYSQQEAIPKLILKKIAKEEEFKRVTEAIENGDFGTLNRLLKGKVLVDAFLKPAIESEVDELEQFSEIVFYLGKLQAVQKLPNEINMQKEEIAERLGVSEELTHHLLQEFTEVKVQGTISLKRQYDQDNQFVYVKTNESLKKLICKQISIMCYLFRKLDKSEVESSLFANILKQDLSKMNNYYKEMSLTTIKHKSKGVSEVFVDLTGKKPKKGRKEKKEESD